MKILVKDFFYKLVRPNKEMKKYFGIVLIILWLLPVVSLADSERPLVEAKICTINIAPVNIRYMTTGPRNDGQKGLRVSFMADEIYKSIIVEEISYGLTEGDEDKIIKSHILDNFVIGDIIGIGSLTYPKFKKWTKWNEFEIEEMNISFRIKYINGQQYEIQK